MSPHKENKASKGSRSGTQAVAKITNVAKSKSKDKRELLRKENKKMTEEKIQAPEIGPAQEASNNKNGEEDQMVEEKTLENLSLEQSEQPPEVPPKEKDISTEAAQLMADHSHPSVADDLIMNDDVLDADQNHDHLENKESEIESLKLELQRTSESNQQLQARNTELERLIHNERINSSKLLNNNNYLIQQNKDITTNFQNKAKKAAEDLYEEHVLVDNLKAQLYEYQKAHRELTNRLQTAQRDTREAKEKIQSQESSLQEAREDIKDLKQRVQTQESSVTRAQEAAVTLLSSTMSSMLPDDTIRRRFADLFESLQDWARDNSLEDCTVLKTSGILDKLHNRNLLADEGEWHRDVSFDLDDTATDTLLNAAVAHEICRAVFETPFFFVDETHLFNYPVEPQPGAAAGTPSTMEISTKAFLQTLLGRIEKENKPAAQAWRAQTVEEMSRGKPNRDGIEKYCEEVTSRFVRKYGRLLNDKRLEGAERGRLFEIVKDFSDLALDLWKQKAIVHFLGLEYFTGQGFKVNSDEMEPARVVRLDEFDDSLDNRPIPVVIQPLIVAFGSADGKDFQKRKIWSKAVVWVSNKNRPEPKSSKRASVGGGWLSGLIGSGRSQQEQGHHGHRGHYH